MSDLYATYVPNPWVSENSFIQRAPENAAPPSFGKVRGLLPQPEWEEHADALRCYWKAWELAFRNLLRPTKANGFVSNYIDTAFNGCIFMWDSTFMMLFGRYGRRAFNFQGTLDNFYAKQHPDGFICREIGEKKGDDRFERFDPTSTGPNVMPWAEWEYYETSADRQRLGRVFPVLAAYHQWLRQYHTWRDGSYWSSGWGCGMDNQPRLGGESSWERDAFQHGHLVWVDACMQQIYAARLLMRMAQALGRENEVKDMQAEAESLTRLVNQRLWNADSAFYYDETRDGRLGTVKSIGAYWGILADAVPPERLADFTAHLRSEQEFNRPHRVPSLSADHPRYEADGGYWLGGVWAPTNYMVLRGLTKAGEDALAHEIGRNHLDNVTAVFEQTGTLWENYAPEKPAPGQPARPDFVGWTGLPPITVLFEYVFGLRPDAPAGRLVWDVRLLEAHGVRQYPFGPDGLLDLHCDRRATAEEKPVISVSSTTPLVLEMRWAGGTETCEVAA